MREQLDKKAKAVNLSVDESAQLVEEVGDANYVNEVVAGEATAVADKSQLDESQVLVQPADAVYSETVQEDVDENEVIDSETLENLSMKVQVSEHLCGAKLVTSNSGSALEEEDLQLNTRKLNSPKL